MRVPVVLYFLIISAVFLLSSCDGGDIIAGKYCNEYEADAEHYVTITSEGKYLHYYRKNGVEQTNAGTWKIAPDKEDVEVVLDDWTDFGLIADTATTKTKVVFVKNNVLLFADEESDEKNFKRCED